MSDLAILLVCLGALAVSIAPCWVYINDDAFISYRFAANLLAGEGLVFNPGERVEGYTNFLWVLVSAALLSVGGPANILELSKLAGAAAAAATVVTSYATARSIFDSRLAAAGSALLLATSPPFAANAVSGLETALVALLIALALNLRLAPGRHADLGFASVMALASLTRPEGFYVFAVLLAFHPVMGVSWRRVVRTGVLFTAFVAPYLSWKIAYYGSLLPNTYYAKPASLLDGLRYALSFLSGAGFGRLAGLPLLALAAGLVTMRRGRGWLLAFLGALGSAVVLSGGDWMLGWRFWVPSLSVICLAMGATLDRLFAALVTRSRGLAFSATIAALVGLVYCLLLPLVPIVAECRARNEGQINAHLFIAKWLFENAQPGESVALMDVGMVGFYGSYAGLRVIDITGLTDAVIGRSPGKISRKEYDPDYVLDQRPEYVVLVGREPIGESRTEGGAPDDADPEPDVESFRFQDRRIASAPAFRSDYVHVLSRLASFEGYLHLFRRRDLGTPR